MEIDDLHDVPLPSEFWSLFSAELAERELTSKVFEEMTGGVHGGPESGATERHFVQRFPNGAARFKALLMGPKATFEPIPMKVMSSLLDGRVSILEAPSGAGAGTVGLLLSLYWMRKRGLVASGPLDVHILGADIATEAEPFFRSVLQRTAEIVASQAIEIRTIDWCQWDGTDVPDTNSLCDHWLGNDSQSVHEEILLISNWSGFGRAQKNFESVQSALLLMWGRLSNRSSSVLWVEPHGRSGSKLLDRVVRRLGVPANWFGRSRSDRAELRFRFFHELLKKYLPSGVTVEHYERKSI